MGAAYFTTSSTPEPKGKKGPKSSINDAYDEDDDESHHFKGAAKHDDEKDV